MFSYFIGTIVASAVRLQLERRGVKQIACDVVAAVLIIAISDVLGWLWMMFFTQSNVVEKGLTVKDLFSQRVDAVSPSSRSTAARELWRSSLPQP